MNLPPKRLLAAVEEFHNWVQLPKCGRLFPKLLYTFTPESAWNELYQVNPSLPGLPGCYIFEDRAGDLYYVGSVSANSGFGYRFANGYVCKDPTDPGKIKRVGNAENCSRIYVVDVPPEHAFIAPALEQFLISYLKPRGNAKDCVDALRRQLISDGRIALPANDN
jgi:hypothetical protein